MCKGLSIILFLQDEEKEIISFIHENAAIISYLSFNYTVHLLYSWISR